MACTLQNDNPAKPEGEAGGTEENGHGGDKDGKDEKREKRK